jgi:hypothetical protein
MTFPVLWHQDAREVRVIVELNTEEVERFALHSFGSGVFVKESFEKTVRLGNLHANADAHSTTQTKKIDHDFESFTRNACRQWAISVTQIVHGAEVDTHFKSVRAKSSH